jgi:hypothetical protein
VLLPCPIHHFPAIEKDEEKRDKINSPTRGRKNANTILTAGQSMERLVGRGTLEID